MGCPLVRILLVDDHLVVREGAVRLLTGAIPALEVHEAEDAAHALAAFKLRSFDVVILDIALRGADGFALLQSLFAEDDRVRVLMFSMHVEAGYVGRALRLGARGYVSKTAPAEELIAAVQAVAAGSRYVEKCLAAELEQYEEKVDPHLTRRENEVLRLLGEGKSLREIAVECGRTYKTISNTVTSIKAKLGVRSATELMCKSMAGTIRQRQDS